MWKVGFAVFTLAGLACIVIMHPASSCRRALPDLLPHGWCEYTNKSDGKPYYYNASTEVTQWTKPKLKLHPQKKMMALGRKVKVLIGEDNTMSLPAHLVGPMAEKTIKGLIPLYYNAKTIRDQESAKDSSHPSVKQV